MPELPFDIVLESDDNATPTTSVSLVLAEDEDGEKAWLEGRLPPFAPQQAPGPVQYGNKEPQSDLVWSQDDWRAGALQAVYDPRDPARYSHADGVDGRWPNMMALGMGKSAVDLIVRNGGAELGATTGWTAGTGVTASAPAAAVRTGTYGFRLVTDGARSAGDVLFSQSFTNPTVYQSKSFTITCAMRMTAGGGGIVLRVYDGVGASSAAAVTASSYTVKTVARTVDAAATEVTIRFVLDSDDVGATTFEIDDVYFVSHTSSSAGSTAPVAATTFKDAFYAVFGTTVCKWDETNDVWNAVYLGSAGVVATSIVAYDANLYVAFGNGDTAYVYGSDTTWTVSTLAGDAKFAHFFAVTRTVDSSGATLWKSRYDAGDSLHTYVNFSTNPINGGSWDTELTVGTTDKKITALHSFNDTVYAAKEDGLYAWVHVYDDGSVARLFENLTPEYATQPNSNNFKLGAAWKGWLYLTASQQTFFRVNRFDYVDLSSLLFSPKIDDGAGGGRVISMAGSPNQLYLLLEGLSTTTRWLCSARFVEGRLVLHVLDFFDTGSLEGSALLFVNDAGDPYLWSMGGVTKDSQTVNGSMRLKLPASSVAPALDATPSLALSGFLYTSAMDWGMPDEVKAFIKLTCIVDPSTVDSNHTIVVSFDINDTGTWTTLGTISTASTAVQTLSFDSISDPETNAHGRSIRFRFNFTSTLVTSSPVLRSFALHASLRPLRVKVWAVNVLLGEGVVMRNGLADPEAKATKLSAIRTLEAQKYPIVLKEDFDGVLSYTSHRVFIRQGSLRRNAALSKVNGQEVHSFEMLEVDFT